MESWMQTMLTIILAVFASSGFWAFLQHLVNKRSRVNGLIFGLSYEKLISMGMDYIGRGWITDDEYEDYRKFYDAYKALGGNGVTERVMAEVTSLPLRPRAKYVEVLNVAKTRRTDDIPSGSDPAFAER